MATGALTPGAALKGFALLIGASFLLVLLTNSMTIWLSFGGVALAAIYPFMKRHTHLPQLFLGAAFSWAIPMAFAAESETLPAYLWLFYAANLCWTMAYDTFYAMVDRDDDLKIGVKSTAILFGENPKKWLFSFILFCSVLMAVSVFVVTQDRTIYSKILSSVGVLSFSLHLFLQWQNFDAKDSQVLLRLFRSNRNAGLIFAIFLCLAIWV